MVFGDLYRPNTCLIWNSIYWYSPKSQSIMSVRPILDDSTLQIYFSLKISFRAKHNHIRMSSLKLIIQSVINQQTYQSLFATHTIALLNPINYYKWKDPKSPQQNYFMSYLYYPYSSYYSSSLYPYYRPYRYYTSSYLDYLDLSSSLRRSRLAADIAVSSIATENALRRSRIETDIALSRITTQNALRRSRLAAELESSRIQREVNLRDSLRRLRAENEVDRILSRY